MTNLAKRTLSSIAFVILILGPLFLSEKIAYSVYSLLGFFTLNEIFKLSQKTGSSPNKPLGLAFYASMLLLVYQLVFGYEDAVRPTALAVGAIGLSIIFVEIFRRNEKPMESMGVTLAAPIYVSLSFLGIAYFLVHRSDLSQPLIVISVFALIWINDSGAYLLGRKIGKTKLFERLSPNKTIEGSLSGLAFSLLAGAGMSFVEGMPSLPIMIGFALVCVVSGSLGDLLESRFKRAANVKDSGVFLPGHGGFFDRFDAMMLAVPASILFFELALPKV